MAWLRRLLNAFRSGRVERDIDRELSFHLAARTEYLRAHGLSREEAAAVGLAGMKSPCDSPLERSAATSYIS